MLILCSLHPQLKLGVVCVESTVKSFQTSGVYCILVFLFLLFADVAVKRKCLVEASVAEIQA